MGCEYIIAPNNRRPASTIVCYIHCLISPLPTVTLIVSLVSTCTEIHHHVQLNRLLLGRGQRGRSLREIVVDNGGDQPILQDETGLTSGTSNERQQPKKCSKTLKKCNRPFVINI